MAVRAGGHLVFEVRRSDWEAGYNSDLGFDSDLDVLPEAAAATGRKKKAPG